MNKNIGDMTESELKDFIIGLQERIGYLERSNNRRDDTIIYLREENIDFEIRIDNAIEYIKRFDFEYLHQCMEHNLVEALENLLEILKGEKE